MPKGYQVLVVRHGESTFNAENRFTGWIDCSLTDAGRSEAANAGSLIARSGASVDRIYSSVLKRCVDSARLISDELPVAPQIRTTWRLNERHYGALQELNKAETEIRFGAEQVYEWRRSYNVRPPALDPSDRRNPAFDSKYAEIPRQDLPLTESLADVVARVMPCWTDEIAPAIRGGFGVLIVAHGNSIRALVKYLENISDDDITVLNIPTGRPFLYQFDESLRPISRQYLT